MSAPRNRIRLRAIRLTVPWREFMIVHGDIGTGDRSNPEHRVFVALFVVYGQCPVLATRAVILQPQIDALDIQAIENDLTVQQRQEMRLNRKPLDRQEVRTGTPLRVGHGDIRQADRRQQTKLDVQRTRNRDTAAQGCLERFLDLRFDEIMIPR